MGCKTPTVLLLFTTSQMGAPDAPVLQGHIAAAAEDFTTSAFSTVEKDILNGSMANNFFP